jgi:hypothetical protein
MAPSTNGLLDLSKCVNLTELAADAFAGLEGIKQLKLPPQIPDTSTYGANIKS